MPYRVEISPRAARDLRRMPPELQDRLEPVLVGLCADPRPHGVLKVQGGEGAYRVRVGDYWVIYDLYEDEQVIVILRVARRSETTYRRL